MLVCRAGLAYIGAKFGGLLTLGLFHDAVPSARQDSVQLRMVGWLRTTNWSLCRRKKLLFWGSAAAFPAGIRENCEKHWGCPVYTSSFIPVRSQTWGRNANEYSFVWDLTPFGFVYSPSGGQLWRGPGIPLGGGGEIFPIRPNRPRGPRSLLYNSYRVSFPRVKRPGHGVDHLSSSFTEVKRKSRYLTPLPVLAFVACSRVSNTFYWSTRPRSIAMRTCNAVHWIGVFMLQSNSGCTSDQRIMPDDPQINTRYSSVDMS